MDVRRLLFPAVYVFCLLLCGVSAAPAQSCANQGCQRPPDNSSCYTCTDVGGVNCSVSNCSSCTESICPTPTPCDSNPYSQACACYLDPNSDACLNCPPNAINCFAMQLSPAPTHPLALPDFRHHLLPKEMVATTRKPSSAGCQTPNLPKKLLFSL